MCKVKNNNRQRKNGLRAFIINTLRPPLPCFWHFFLRTRLPDVGYTEFAPLTSVVSHNSLCNPRLSPSLGPYQRSRKHKPIRKPVLSLHQIIAFSHAQHLKGGTESQMIDSHTQYVFNPPKVICNDYLYSIHDDVPLHCHPMFPPNSNNGSKTFLPQYRRSSAISNVDAV